MEAGAAISERVSRDIDAAGGAISFARFMERALYEPGFGYYERAAVPVGKGGDFYTSVSVGPLFGELLAHRFAGYLEDLAARSGPNERFQLVESGAHDGQLAADILAFLDQWRPELAARTDYWLVEPSSTRQKWQRSRLAPYGNRVRWWSRLDCLPPVSGVVLGNELLDAFPVHRLGWDAGRREWFEWGVGRSAAGLAWCRLPVPTVPVPALVPELLEVLPDGFSTEVCPAAEAWWGQAAACLRSGWLFTADYGLEAAEFFVPRRAGGTLRAYEAHRLVDVDLNRPGAQDLTAHVNFSVLCAAGERQGLKTDCLTGQRRFLTEVFAETQRTPGRFPDWDARRVRQFQTLTHPEHLGSAFSILVQSRSEDPRDLVAPASDGGVS